MLLYVVFYVVYYVFSSSVPFSFVGRKSRRDAIRYTLTKSHRCSTKRPWEGGVPTQFVNVHMSPNPTRSDHGGRRHGILAGGSAAGGVHAHGAVGGGAGRSFHGLGLGRISTLSGCLLTCQAGG